MDLNPGLGLDVGCEIGDGACIGSRIGLDLGRPIRTRLGVRYLSCFRSSTLTIVKGCKFDLG